jgi:hypothetical protein
MQDDRIGERENAVPKKKKERIWYLYALLV